MPEKIRRQIVSEELFRQGLLGNPDMEKTNALKAEYEAIVEAEKNGN